MGGDPLERPILVHRVIARLNIGGPALHVVNLTEGLDRSGGFRTHLIAGSITGDEGDMSYYARERGVDLATWSFLTGDKAAMAALVREWGIGSVRQEDGTIDHTLISFLVRDGRVLARYTMADAQEGQLLQDLIALGTDASAAANIP